MSGKPVYKFLEILLGGTRKFSLYSEIDLLDAEDLANHLDALPRTKISMLGRWLYQDIDPPPDDDTITEIIDLLDITEESDDGDKE